MKRPAFQFYPGDWRSNANLRRCTHKERGIWIDVMCLLHDSEEYGILRWPLKELAEAVSCRPAELASLVSKGVLKGADAGRECEAFVYTPRHAGKDGDPVTLVPVQPGPVWFSSRMVKDEYLRSKRGEGSRFGEEPKATPDSAPKPPIGTHKGPGASSSSSSSSSEKREAAPAFVPEPDWKPAEDVVRYRLKLAGKAETWTPANLQLFIASQRKKGISQTQAELTEGFAMWMIREGTFNAGKGSGVPTALVPASRAPSCCLCPDPSVGKHNGGDYCGKHMPVGANPIPTKLRAA